MSQQSSGHDTPKPHEYDHAATDRVEKAPKPGQEKGGSPQQKHNDEDHG